MSDTARLPRFFTDSPLTQGVANLSGSEAHHLMHVLRLETDDRVVLFDGSGRECQATIRKSNRHEVTLDAEEPVLVNRERTNQVTVAVSLPKGERQKFLVEKLTELGVSRMIPLVTRRGVAQPSGAAIQRLEMGVIAASKQCGRNRLMEIGEPMKLDGLLENTSATGTRLVAHPGADNVQLAAMREIGDAVIAIGPEGGFENEEVALLVADGWVKTGLGRTVLRVETAALAAATLLCIGQPD